MDGTLIGMIITIVCSVLASSGLWTFISKWSERHSNNTALLMGLAHERIMHLGKKYVARGYMTMEEHDDLYKYLYEPYSKNGGNGSAEKIMKKVDLVPIVSLDDVQSLDALIDKKS